MKSKQVILLVIVISSLILFGYAHKNTQPRPFLRRLSSMLPEELAPNVRLPIRLGKLAAKANMTAWPKAIIDTGRVEISWQVRLEI